MAETLEVKIECAARHEPGHIVVAAAQGLRLMLEGLILDSFGEGLACYCKQPDGSDDSRKRVIVATFAGFFAERRFREDNGYALTDPEYWFCYSCDGREANQLLSEISLENLLNTNVPATRAKLQSQSKQLVEQHSVAIEALARALLAKDWQDWKPLKSGAKFSRATTAKYLAGEEVVSILKRYGISAVCASEC